ncbi:hypothetical protein [Neorhizobium petrolearium]|uniref:hypothetical protein n=1 Tax=Neorhizobium petrolearium TaxID=515361 RepID=UPI003F5CEE54
MAVSSSLRPIIRAATAADFSARRSRQQPSHGGSARIRSQFQGDTGGEGGVGFTEVAAARERPAWQAGDQSEVLVAAVVSESM